MHFLRLSFGQIKQFTSTLPYYLKFLILVSSQINKENLKICTRLTFLKMCPSISYIRIFLSHFSLQILSKLIFNGNLFAKCHLSYVKKYFLKYIDIHL